jgi:hypothetical protein
MKKCYLSNRCFSSFRARRLWGKETGGGGELAADGTKTKSSTGLCSLLVRISMAQNEHEKKKKKKMPLKQRGGATGIVK